MITNVYHVIKYYYCIAVCIIIVYHSFEVVVVILVVVVVVQLKRIVYCYWYSNQGTQGNHQCNKDDTANKHFMSLVMIVDR